MSGAGYTDCGYHFEMNRDYIVYASKEHGVLYTDVCDRTMGLDHPDASAELAALDALQIVYIPKPAPVWPAAALLALAAFLVGVALTVVYHRTRGRTDMTRVATLILLFTITAGCTQHVNPSFALTEAEAERDLERMEAHPVALRRPVVVVGGFLDVGLGPWWVIDAVTTHTGDERVVGVTFPVWMSMDEARRHLVGEVRAHFGDAEVDVIGLSMGGVIPRDAAMPRAGEPALRLARLFTIASPHDGAQLAAAPGVVAQHLALREGSDYLNAMNAALPDAPYELYAYTRLRDRTVGEAHTAPPGASPRWVDNPWFAPAHYGAFNDERILADILRRLRDEQPWSRDPPAPLPARH